MKELALIFGHGAGDPGAVSSFGKEAEFVRSLKPSLLSNLKVSGLNVTVLDDNVNWYKFLQSNTYDFKKFDYVLEIHANSGVHDPNGDGGTTGTEIYVTSKEKDLATARAVVAAVASTGLRNRGLKVNDFSVIRKINAQGVSASLLEVFFVGDKDDYLIFKDNVDKIGSNIAKALLSSFGISESKPEVKPEAPKPVAPSKPVGYDKDYSEVGEFRINTGRSRYLCDSPKLSSKTIGTVANATPVKYNRVVFNEGRIWCYANVLKGWVSTGSYDKSLKRTESFADFSGDEPKPVYPKRYDELGKMKITTGKARYICDTPSLKSKELGTLSPSAIVNYVEVVFNDGRIWVRLASNPGIVNGWVSVGSYDSKTMKKTESFANCNL